MFRSPWLSLILLVSCASAALAQDPPKEPPPRIEASAQFAFLDSGGNAPAQSLGAAGSIKWRTGLWTYEAKSAFTQVETEEILSARSITALGRAERKIRERISLYGQYDYLRDLFAGIEQRHIVEGGVSYAMPDRGRHRLRGDVGLGYLNERRLDGTLESATLGTAALYKFVFSDKSEFTYEPRYILAFADTGAWKFDQVATVTAAINSIFSLKLAHTIRYVNEPPAGFEKTDTILAISLVAKVTRK